VSELWWREATVYQIYVRSFADSNGDGVGDLEGIRSRLGYLQELGVEALWLTPFYPSPMVDNGYDVANPRDVDPLFGDLADFDRLVADAHARGIRVTVDVVPNHSSSEHPWFQAAVAAAPGSPERARYWFRDGKGDHGEEPPNNWLSVFSGPAWTRVEDGQWYLHLFAPEQPDLNWANPEVVADFEQTLRFWLDRGADGFRVDVAHGLAKPADLPDMDPRAIHNIIAHTKYFDPRFDNDDVHELHAGVRRVLDEYPGAAAVGEIWVSDDERWGRYITHGRLHLGFNFHLVLTHFDAGAMRSAIDKSLAIARQVGAPPTWTLGNHDVWRQVSRYGGGEVGLQRARAMALVELALPGAVYLYNGEELGLPNGVLTSAQSTDPGATSDQRGSRDVARIPLPWSGDSPPFGFTTGASTWLPMPPEWADRTVERQSYDPGSTLTLYRTALQLRRSHSAIRGETITWDAAPPGCLAFRRDGGLLCVLNTSDGPIDLPPGELLLSSGEVEDGKLPADSAAWLI
jgi:alpha-glucosidase